MTAQGRFPARAIQSAGRRRVVRFGGRRDGGERHDPRGAGRSCTAQEQGGVKVGKANPTEEILKKLQKAQAAAEADGRPIFECPICGGRAGWRKEMQMGQWTGRRHVWCMDCGIDLKTRW